MRPKSKHEILLNGRMQSQAARALCHRTDHSTVFKEAKSFSLNTAVVMYDLHGP